MGKGVATVRTSITPHENVARKLSESPRVSASRKRLKEMFENWSHEVCKIEYIDL